MGQIIPSGFLDEISNDLQEQLDAANEAGLYANELRSVDGVNVLKMEMERHEQVRDEHRRRGMRITAVGSPVGKVTVVSRGKDPRDTVIRYDDGREMPILEYLFGRHGEDGDLVKACKLAKFYGTEKIRAFTYWLPEGDRRCEWGETVLWIVDQMGEFAAKNGVKLGMEFERGLYGNVGGNVRWLLDRVVYPGAVGVVFDPANIVLEGEKPLDALRDTVEYLMWLHIKDAKALVGREGQYLWVPEDKQKFKVPGFGGGQIEPVMERLRPRIVQSGVDIPATMEPHLLMSDAEAGASRYGGKSGPGNFGRATRAYLQILDRLEIPYHKGSFQ